MKDSLRFVNNFVQFQPRNLKIPDLKKWCYRDKYHIEYGGYLSNHFSHGVIAISGIGCPEDRVEKFCLAYRDHEVFGHKLEPPKFEDRKEILNDEELFQILGKKQNYLGITDYLIKVKKEKYGNDSCKLMNYYLPKLLDGIVASALHPLISLGYALEVFDEELIIDAMAYMVYSHISLGPLNNSEKLNKTTTEKNYKTLQEAGLNIPAIFKKIRNEGKLSAILEHNKDKPDTNYGPFIKKTLAIVQYGSKQIDEYVKTYLLKDSIYEFVQKDWKTFYSLLFDDILSIYDLTAEFHREDDFFILHMVTSLWALGQVAEYLTADMRYELTVTWLKAAFGVYVIEGCPYFEDVKSDYTYKKKDNNIPSWKEIRDFVNESNENNVHTIKVAFTCLDRIRNQRIFIPVEDPQQDEFLKVVASRRLGMLGW